MLLLFFIVMLACKPNQDTDAENDEMLQEIIHSTSDKKYDTLIVLTANEPEREKFIKSYFNLTEDVLMLADTLIYTLLNEGRGENPLPYFSKNKNTDRFYLKLMKMYSSGRMQLQSPARKEKLDTLFANIKSSTGSAEWMDNLFKGKLGVEALADLREIQTNCLITRNLVYDDMIDQLTKK